MAIIDARQLHRNRERPQAPAPHRIAITRALESEFLTAVHHKLPMKVVVYNNSAFGLIPLEAEAVGLPPYKEAIEFPNPDFPAWRGHAAVMDSGRRSPACGTRRSTRRSKSTGPQSSIALWPPTRCPTFRMSSSGWSGTTRWRRSGRRCLQLRDHDAAARSSGCSRA